MTTIREALGDGETIIAEAHFPWIYGALAWAALIFLGIFLAGSVIFIVMMVKRWTTGIAVTNQRFVQKTGLIWRRTDAIALSDIANITVTQTALGRFFDYGKVRIESVKTDAVITPDIADAAGFARAIEAAKTS